MGKAAYDRGSRLITQQIEREGRKSRLVPIDRYDLEALEDQRDRLREENSRLQRDLDRAMRAKRVLSLTLTEERRRAREAIATLQSRRDEYLGTGASAAHYVAIVTLLGAKRALGYD